MSNKYSLKFFLLVVTFFTITLLQGCGEEIDYRQTETINGLLYKLNYKEPFSGKVTNFPMNILDIMNIGSCDMQIKKGLLDGTLTCNSNNGVKIAEIEYKDNKKMELKELGIITLKNLNQK